MNLALRICSKQPVVLHAMQLLKWLLVRNIWDSNQTFGAVVWSYTPWSVASFLSKIQRRPIFTKRYWLETTKFLSFYHKIVHISCLKYWIPIQINVLTLRRFEDIHGSSNKKIESQKECFRDKSRCQWMTRCTKRCLMNLTTILIIQSNALKLTDITKSLPPIICLQRELSDKTKTLVKKGLVRQTWSEVLIEDRSQPGCNS